MIIAIATNPKANPDRPWTSAATTVPMRTTVITATITEPESLVRLASSICERAYKHIRSSFASATPHNLSSVRAGSPNVRRPLPPHVPSDMAHDVLLRSSADVGRLIRRLPGHICWHSHRHRAKPPRYQHRRSSPGRRSCRPVVAAKKPAKRQAPWLTMAPAVPEEVGVPQADDATTRGVM